MSDWILPDWLKNEESIYEQFKNIIDDIRYQYIRHIQIKDENWTAGIHYCAPSSWYADIPQDIGIEMDNNNLKPITIALTNWERQVYIPAVLDMYNNQDYPKNLIEILIVDDQSANKEEVLNIVKEQAKLYPDIKMRFIQSYFTKTIVTRANIGVRHASNDIVIINETDMIPLGKNYLRGICYLHNKFNNLSCTGIPIGLGTKDDMVNRRCGVFNRFGGGVFTFNKQLFSQIRGLDEKRDGWGGHEGNIASRYLAVGGKIALNLHIYSGNLPNFPVPLPPGVVPAGTGGDDWQQGIVINDENWGISPGMKEIDLYQ